jgi:uncharacterized membrane protein
VIGRRDDFRWRSHEITRIEGFSDAVFAFAVTLLVVSLEVPRTFEELAETMQGFFAFALGSALLFLIWYSQYKFFRRYGMQDVTTIVLNGALLFVVLFFVYPLKFLFNFLIKVATGHPATVLSPRGVIEQVIRPDQTDSLMIIYGLGYVAVFGILTFLYVHAYRQRVVLELNDLETFDTRAGIREHALHAAVGLLSIGVAWIGGPQASGVAGFTYVLVGPLLTVHGAFTGKRRRILAARLNA